MNLDRTVTSSVYVVNSNKVLLHMHKKYKTLFPLGGKMESNEVPHETAIREAYEESGLEIELYNEDEKFEMGRVKQLCNPIHLLLENVGHETENIDFIYFATCKSISLKPMNGESEEFFWLTEEEIINNKNIKPHVKSMALDALNKVIY